VLLFSQSILPFSIKIFFPAPLHVFYRFSAVFSIVNSHYSILLMLDVLIYLNIGCAPFSPGVACPKTRIKANRETEFQASGQTIYARQ